MKFISFVQKWSPVHLQKRVKELELRNVELEHLLEERDSYIVKENRHLVDENVALRHEVETLQAKTGDVEKAQLKWNTALQHVKRLIGDIETNVAVLNHHVQTEMNYVDLTG